MPPRVRAQASKPRDVIRFSKDTAVAAGGSDESVLTGGPLGDGDRWMIQIFGASEAGTGDGIASVVKLQLGRPGNWTTLRSFGLSSTVAEVSLERVVTGNGTKRLRVVRENRSAAGKPIMAWVEAYKL